MFSGEESIRIESPLSGADLEAILEKALDSLGRVYFEGRGEFEIASRRRFQNAMATTEIHGRLTRGRRDGEWRLTVNYTVSPTGLCWAVVVLAALFFLVGLLVLIVPHNLKNDVHRAVRRAIRDARDDAEDEA